ncbi:unnamed protein product [Ostreobium quekettii]|uniref:Uncharacterized protein n=1 Tax=Ostreobium quekettii TaxID=121088 RepID=A0A8S1J8T5_9CHLO|nr:unnamed protein product [Ostreobium quekettii]
MTANRSRLTADDVRTMWKRAVYTHLDDKGRVLKANAPDATVGGRAFLRGLARETMARREEFDTAQLRDIGWASGRLWFSDAELMAMVKGGLVAALAEGRIPVTETIPVIWALAQSGNYPQEVLDALVEMGGERIGELNAQNCTNLLWAMAFSGYHPGDAFLGLLCDTALARFDDSPKSVIAQTVSDMLWACGRLGHPEPGKVAGRCVDWARPRMGSFTAGELVAAVQGLAMMGALERGDMERACRRFQKLLAKVAMPSVALDRVVALTMLFPGEERAELQGLLFGESRDRLRKEREVWQAEVAHRMRTNSFITSISAQLEELSIYHQVGSVLGGGQLAVELLVEKEGRMHGLVPVHSMSVNRNGGSIVLGEVGLARRLLEAQELPIAGLISMAEWDRCKDDQDVKKRLVQRAVEGG